MNNLTIQDLNIVARVLGVKADDMFDTAKAVQPQLNRRHQARQAVQAQARRA